jgi:outer membrane protein assembly factor BamD (BamD/ComL family)
MPKALSIALGLLILLSFFGLVIWFIWRRLKRSEDPAKNVFKIIISLVLGAFLAYTAAKELGGGGGGMGAAFIVGISCAIVGILWGIIWAPNIGAAMAKPLTSLFDGGDLELEPQPLYSIAIAKRKAGHYQEAIQHIQGQLEKFPTDVTGQLMLAEIQAEDLHDLTAADLTIQRFCNQPGHAPANLALALNQLADHYLKVARDPEGARQALERIVEMLPNSAQAQQAQQRLAHLANQEEMQQAQGRTIRMEGGVQNIGLMKDSSALRKAEVDPAEKAAEYVKHLEQFPQDTEAREKLAMIYAEHYQRPDLAIVQLESLIEQPNAPAKDVVRWLSLIADFQMLQGNDYETVRQTLERIIDLYPARSYAENARQRIEHLKLQMKGREEEKRLTLGVYEQNLGLKKGKPQVNPDEQK